MAIPRYRYNLLHAWLRQEACFTHTTVQRTFHAVVPGVAILAAINGMGGLAFSLQELRRPRLASGALMRVLGDRARIGGLRPHAIAVLVIGVAGVWITSGITAMRKRAEVPTSHAPAS